MIYPTGSSLPAAGYISPPDGRNVAKVPFVELHGGRLQGVVSSSSDIQRVYVSYFEAGSLDYSCSTNNNRPCGGLNGSPCNHLRELLGEAITQFGLARVLTYLRVPGEQSQIYSEYDFLKRVGQGHTRYAADIFSRFLADLEWLEQSALHGPLPAMAWFPAQVEQEQP